MRKHRLNRASAEDRKEWNPMDGIANLVDVMLVLAVGVMLALVINWNVDITNKAHIDKENALEVSEDELEKASDQDSPQDGQDMKEMGKVYYDEETGMYYLVEGK